MSTTLLMLALGNLVIGTGAFLLTGILVPVSEDLGVSVAAAGQAMTAYAVSTALLAPLMVMATGRWPRRRALIAAMAVFGAGGLVCAAAPNLAVLLAGRVLMGVGAAFTPIAAGVAVAIVEPARRGRALSVVFLGVSLSYVIGLPVGAWLGLRHGWAAPVAVIAAIALLTCGLLKALLPREIQAPGASFRGVGILLRRGDVLNALGLTLLYFTAIFLVFSYIGPVLKALVPMDAGRLSITLMLFGLSGMVGTIVGGWENDRFGWRRTLFVHLVVLTAMMGLVPLTGGSYPALLAVLLVWGVAGFGMMTAQQSRLAMLSPPQVPLLLSLNASMLYVGTALGAAIGGLVAPEVGFGRLAWVGVPLGLVGLVLLLVARSAPRPCSERAGT